MPGLHITTLAAREGCLSYIDTIEILSAAQRKQLRQQLLFAPAREVADKFWRGLIAQQQSTAPKTVRELEIFGPRIGRLCQALERLAVEPEHFRQFYQPLQKAA